MRTNRIKHILRENLYNGANDSRIDSLKDFVKFCQRHLKLTNLPKIDLTNDKSKTTTYAHNDIANDEIVVYMGNRSLGDVMRSLAHELVHYEQKQNGKLKHDGSDGVTGSPIENEANAVAGVIMREYGQNNPHIFESTIK
jgi:hypothetical protein